MGTSQQQSGPVLDFTHSDARIAELLGLVQEISDLEALGALAGWDQNTALPDGAGEVRGSQLATLQGAVHERWTAARLGALVSELHDVVQAAPYTDADRGLVRVAKRSYDQSVKLPRGLVQEMARVGASAFESWRRARGANDFASFAPWLSRTISLQREVADRLGFTETRYDALLDLYEPGLTASTVASLFAPVREASTRLLRRIQASGTQVDDACVRGSFDAERQVALCDKVLRAMGYDFSRGGMARSPHPFTTSFGSPFDVRVTVRTDEAFLPTSVMAAIHEGGHAVYEQGTAAALVRTPLASGASMGAHESQSRLWENAIGRSEAFWQGQMGLLREAFPQAFGEVDAATVSRALNRVQPSLIRVEADEVTYNLHIIIRFELEQAMVNGEVAVESLPRMWNEKYREYLGVEAPTESDGILQDIHWTSGFGYFPTYTLGNLYGAQIYARLRETFPDFDARLAAGETGFVLEWLQRTMYVSGATFLPEDLITRVTGQAPDPRYFETYLRTKFERVYQLAPEA